MQGQARASVQGRLPERLRRPGVTPPSTSGLGLGPSSTKRAPGVARDRTRSALLDRLTATLEPVRHSGARLGAPVASDVLQEFRLASIGGYAELPTAETAGEA